MKNFRERLIEKIEQKKSIVCVGLDPNVNVPSFPSFLKEGPKPKLEFAKMILDEVADLVPVVKPNTRFYSMHPDDYEGDQLAEIVKYAHKQDLEVIADCKENDIGSTMANAYENQFKFGYDAITVNSYLGSDGVIGDGIFNKWFKDGKGLFLLVKTSNPSSVEFQDVKCLDIAGDIAVLDWKRLFSNDYLKNYHLMASLVELWSKEFDHVIGGVVGATQEEQLGEISQMMEGLLLIPGYGAQGGKAEALKHLQDGRYCIVNSSRKVMYAYKRRFKGSFETFATASRKEVEFMNKDLNKHFKPFNK